MLETCEQFSHITDNLWLGAVPGYSGIEIQKFKYIFAFNGRPMYPLLPGQTVIAREFEDCDDLPNTDMLNDMVDLALKFSAKGPTLLHCTAGLNRSALVMGLVLIKMGYTPRFAVAVMREKRSDQVLFNKTFFDYLMTFEKNPEIWKPKV